MSGLGNSVGDAGSWSSWSLERCHSLKEEGSSLSFLLMFRGNQFEDIVIVVVVLFSDLSDDWGEGE